MTWSSEIELAEQKVMDTALDVIDEEIRKVDEQEKKQKQLNQALNEAVTAYELLKEQNGKNS